MIIYLSNKNLQKKSILAFNSIMHSTKPLSDLSTPINKQMTMNIKKKKIDHNRFEYVVNTM